MRDSMDFLWAFLGTFLYVCLAVAVMVIIAQWKVYEKAGKPGWAAIIPIYNIIVLMEIIGKPPWWVILYFIPGVNIIFIIWATNLLSKSFGKDEAFTVGLLILSVVFWPILGFGNAQYQGPAGDYVYEKYGNPPSPGSDGDDLV
ncbi:MAG: DUF5684 domain-containing protein [Saprospiraceae bacterium]|nr:DUF5684 domain-containing protein [Saprospiraceae bacterium]